LIFNGEWQDCSVRQKKVSPQRFSAIFPQRLKILNKSLQAFKIFISTQSYNISFNYLQLRQSYAMFKHDRFINFYISLEKNAKNCNISATVRRISIKFNVMKQNVSLKCKAVKNLNFNIPRWRTTAITQLEEQQQRRPFNGL